MVFVPKWMSNIDGKPWSAKYNINICSNQNNLNKLPSHGLLLFHQNKPTPRRGRGTATVEVDEQKVDTPKRGRARGKIKEKAEDGKEEVQDEEKPATVEETSTSAVVEEEVNHHHYS